MSTLVTYSTSHGSTREVAERIASRLQAAGLTVELIPAEVVERSKLYGYSSFIIGSPLHMGHWLDPARQFVSRNSDVLKSKPVWAFSTGMPPDDKKLRQEEQMIERKIKKELPDLKGNKLFQGRAEKDDFGWFLGIFFKHVLPDSSWGDHRNWGDINTWVDGVEKDIRALS